MTPPLSDIFVCDLSQNLAGPYCTQILADLGATVVKIEPPGGDLARDWGPPFWGEYSALFLSANRGKKSVVLDLKSDAGREALHRLVRRSDVFVQASRPAVSRRLGFDYPSVRSVREDIVYLGISAYGKRGPLAEMPGYDPLMQAYSGIMSLTGHPGGPPTRVGGAVVDYGTGMWAAMAILSALRVRDRTGEGTELEASLLDTAIGWVSYHIAGYLGTDDVPGPMGSGLASIAPYQAFPTVDGWVMIAAGNDGLFGRLCAALEAPELASDERFASNPSRVRHRDELTRLLEERTRPLTTEQLLALAREYEVPASSIQTLDQVVDDPQVDAAEMIPTVADADLEGYRDVALPFRFGGERPRAAGSPPRAGADTEEVLEMLGYEASEIADLVRKGVAERSGRNPT